MNILPISLGLSKWPEARSSKNGPARPKANGLGPGLGFEARSPARSPSMKKPESPARKKPEARKNPKPGPKKPQIQKSSRFFKKVAVFFKK